MAQGQRRSIYGTTASPFKMWTPWGCVTQGRQSLSTYLCWPEDGPIGRSTYRMGWSRPICSRILNMRLNRTPSDQGTTIALPAHAPDPIDSVIVLEINDSTKMTELSLNLAQNKPWTFPVIWPGREDD